jgi:hypothetical protein
MKHKVTIILVRRTNQRMNQVVNYCKKVYDDEFPTFQIESIETMYLADE